MSNVAGLDKTVVAQTILWAHEELRDLDEFARGQIPGFASWDSDEMEKVNRLEKIGLTLMAEAGEEERNE